MKGDRSAQKGMILLESVFCILACILVMSVLLAFGFFFYQKCVLGVVANQIAEEIAHTYKFPDVTYSEDITKEDVSEVGRYRYLLYADLYKNENQKKGAYIANVRLPMTSLAKARGEAEVEIETFKDDVGRMHYKITVTQAYNYLLGNLLVYIGIDTDKIMSSTVYVQGVDISSYVNWVQATKYSLNKLGSAIPALDALNSVIGLVHSIYDLLT